MERCFIISGDDLLNNFSSAYITSVRQDNYFTGYKILEIEAGEKKAQYFEFEMPTSGFFDFCIKQFSENSVPAVNQSRLSISGTEAGYRYLKNKYILVRDNSSSQASELRPSQQAEPIQASMANSNIYNSNAKEYRQPRFTVYEI